MPQTLSLAGEDPAALHHPPLLYPLRRSGPLTSLCLSLPCVHPTSATPWSCLSPTHPSCLDPLHPIHPCPAPAPPHSAALLQSPLKPACPTSKALVGASSPEAPFPAITVAKCPLLRILAQRKPPLPAVRGTSFALWPGVVLPPKPRNILSASSGHSCFSGSLRKLSSYSQSKCAENVGSPLGVCVI